MVKPFRNTRNYFISEDGYVFKVVYGREVKVPATRDEKNNRVVVNVDEMDYDLAHVMIQHFITRDIKETDAIRYTVNSKNCIPLCNIVIASVTGNKNLTRAQSLKLAQYKCEVKALSANNRCMDNITGVEVLLVLERHDFKCVYCGSEIKPKDWHLDHFLSLAKGGKNIIGNLVPSCPTCNIMKGALEGYQFYKRCMRVAVNFRFKSKETQDRDAYLAKELADFPDDETPEVIFRKRKKF